MQKKISIETVVQHSCLLGEGPVWDARRNSICWVDILNGEIHEVSTENKTHKIIAVHQKIGAINICSDGNFLAALQNGLAFIHRENGKIKMIANPEEHLSNNRFNDGKCDPAGRFWVGSMSLIEEEGAGSVYVLEKDLSITKKIENTTIANGMAWSVNHKNFYFIDTPTYNVFAYDYDKDSGSIKNKRTIIKIAKEDGFPDGMTIDSQGMLWIAHWDGWQVTRWNPDTEEKIFAIKLPAAKITSCCFGGKNLEDLYITSAKTGLTENELIEQPLAGNLFVVKDCGFKGIPTIEF
jgi:sugar lactone lactonase YvrE